MGNFKPGDALPTEIALIKDLGVSRASVRSGLQVLAAAGMILRRARVGTVVEQFREWNLLNPLVSQWMSNYGAPNPDLLKQIFDFRFSVEPYVSAVAALEATANDLARIEVSLLAMERAANTAEHADFSRHDIEFHSAIYGATHNLVWAQLSHVLAPAIDLVIRTSNATAEQLRESFDNHLQVFECIRMRRPEDAFDAAVRVLSRTAIDIGVETISTDRLAGPPNIRSPRR
ncbi:MAG: FadR family transcriptional regulator [Rhodobacteraceae bacterium]|nr:FadR family transcriptional regulator [Paracoccaceae bacterium]